MDITASTHYRNLSHLSVDEWKNLDIHLFIAANFNRYCGLLIKKIGYQHLPSDAMESLLGLYCAVAYKPLVSVHSRNIDAEGEKRNQVMLGTLKMISTTRMVDAVIQEYPAYVSLDNMEGSGDPESLKIAENNALRYSAFTFPEHASLAAANDVWFGENDIDPAEGDEKLTMMIETLRHELTVSQYQVLRHLLCDHYDIHQIAELTGTTLTNIRIMLQNIRRKLHSLLPPDTAKRFEHCLYRK
jgi:hypothetical protein